MDELHKEANQHESPQEHKKHSKYANIVIGVLAVIVGILLIAILQNTQSPQDSTGTDPEQMDPEVAMEEPPAITFEFDALEDWELLERATEGVQDLARGQELEFGIVTDPSDEKFVYFATSVYDTRKKENLVSVYKYNTENFNFERLFRRSYSVGDFTFLAEEAIPNFHVIGYDDGQLVILAQDMNDSPERCAQPLLLGAEHDDVRTLISMSINDPYAGFNEYTPPQEVIDDAKSAQALCQDEELGTATP